MHDLAASLVFLLVSCVSFIWHSLAVIRLARSRAESAAERMVTSGYVRTVACRVLAATTYIVVAALQLAGVANLTETTIVFTCVQVLWMLNSRGDVRIKARIRPRVREPSAPPETLPTCRVSPLDCLLRSVHRPKRLSLAKRPPGR